MHVLFVQIHMLRKHGWTLAGSKNVSMSWETSTRQVIGVGLQDKKRATLKQVVLSFTSPEPLPSCRLSRSSAVSLLLHLDFTVPSVAAITVRGKAIYSSVSVFMYIRVHVLPVTLTDKIKDPTKCHHHRYL
jgi:hypothetical protein